MKLRPIHMRHAALLMLLAVLASTMLGAAWGSTAPSPSSVGLSHTQSAASEPLQITPWKMRPVLGGQKTLVLLVQFPDVRFMSSMRSITALVDSVDQWFRTSSYGKMYIDYTIYEEVLTLPELMALYGLPQEGASRGDDPSRLDAYLSDTLNIMLSETDVDLTNYAHIVIIHSGGDEATATGNPNEIWSFCACEGPYAEENPEEASWRLIDDEGNIVHVFWGVSTFSEDESWGVFAHEFTHSLGVSDLYVYGSDDYSEGTGVGFWSMMDAGSFLDPPADIDGWSKYILGWVEPVIVDAYQGEYTIYTLDSTNEPKALLIRIDAEPNLYYFVHARRLVGTDAALPSEGVIVFKIDATRERSYRGMELAIINDANPETPSECSMYEGFASEACQMLDAPYNEKGKEYSFSYGALSAAILLNNDAFWDPDAGIVFLAQPAGESAFKITLASSPEELGISITRPPTTTTATVETTTQPSGCVIATAAFGSEMAHDVAYMRFVRDKLIGSTNVGRILVKAFNEFYYSWSPPVARLIATNRIAQAVFRIILFPLTWIVKAAALLFTTVDSLTGNREGASVISFLFATSMSIACYVGAPVLIMSSEFKRKRSSRIGAL